MVFYSLLMQTSTRVSYIYHEYKNPGGGGHSATNRKVAGSIPDGVIGIFEWHNPSGRTRALGSIQPLTEMSTRNIPLAVKAAGV
jgi:hypothetical protein